MGKSGELSRRRGLRDGKMEDKMEIAVYKGRKYKLVWRGQTKYGERTKLAFFDGSKEFWVSSDLVTVGSSGQSYRRSSRYLCPQCGNPADGGDGAPGYMCGEPCGP